MKNIIFLLRIVYWCVIAWLPVALKYQGADFTLWAIGHPNAACLSTGVPLMVNTFMYSYALMLLLWPLAAWNLGGKFLWQRYGHKGAAAVREDLEDS